MKFHTGIERLEQASRHETVLVVSPDAAPAPLLDRVADAKKAGASIFALDQGDTELDELVHESLALRYDEAPISFDAAQHLVSYSVADPGLADLADLAASSPVGRGAVPALRRGTPGPSGLRGKLNRLLETISGSQPD